MFVDFHILNELGSPSINSNTFANRPPAGQIGRLFVSTDTFEIYRDNGTTWDLIGGPGSSTVTGTGAATQVAFWTAAQAIGGSNNLWWDNTNARLGINNNAPGAALDIHSTGVIAQLNSTGTTNNSYLAFQRNGSGVWRIGDNYNSGNNQFEIHNTVLTVDAVTINAATNKTSWQAQQTYTSGLARGNYFDYNLSVSAGGSFSSPNAITALGATLDLTLAGNATIPSGARSGLDAYNSISFTGTGTLTHNQGTQIRAYSNVTAGWAFNGSATGTITHLAGLRALFPDNSGSAVTINNNYALLLNDQTANTGTVTYTNRWGVYQEGASDLNYFAANTLIGTTTNSGEKLVVNGTSQFTNLVSITGGASITLGLRALQLPTGVESTINSGLSVRTGVAGESIVQFGNNLNTYYTGTVNAAKAGAMIRLDTRGVAPIPNASAYSVFQIQTRAAGTADPNYTVPVQIAAAPNGSFCIDASGRGYFYNGMRVGASASAPTNALSVTGNADFTGSVGIATNNPTYKLDINNVGGTSATARLYGNDQANVRLRLENAGAGGRIWELTGGLTGADNSAFTIYDVTAAATRLQINASGNLGLGVTPSAWGGGYKAIEINSTGVYASNGSNGTVIGHNFYYDGTNDKYLTTGAASRVFQFQGAIRFDLAASGTAGNAISFTQAMTLTAGGNFLIGTTTDEGQKLQVNGTILTNSPFTIRGTGPYIQWTNNSNTRQGYIQHNGTNLVMAADVGNIDLSNNTIITGYVKTSAPSGGTAANWKLGSRVAATVVVNTTEYIEVDIGGTLYKLATVT